MNVDKVLCDYNIFLTGASGFVGSVILSRLLNINNSSDCKIFCLLRCSKKYNTVHERLRNSILKNDIFEYSDNEIDELLLQKRIIPLEGELTSELLGLDNKSISLLKYSTNSNNKKGIIVIHCAADIDFNREINQSININVYGTYQCICLSSEISAKSFIHISTLYVNSREHRDCNIREEIYDQGIDMVNIFNKWLNNNNKHFNKNEIKQIRLCTSKNNPLQRQNWPNTYTFTKNMAENIVKYYCNKYNILTSVIRLGIVSPIHRGNNIGWFMGNGGFVFLVIGIATGNIRYLNGDGKGRPDFVPVDYTTDCILAVTANTIYNPSTSNTIYQCGVIGNKPSWTVSECFNYVRPRFFNDSRIKNNNNVQSYLKSDCALTFIESKTLFYFIELILYEIPLLLLSLISYILTIFTHIYWLKLYYNIFNYRYDININKRNLKSSTYNLSTSEQIRSIKLLSLSKPYLFVKRSLFMKKARNKLNWFNANYTYFVNQRWNFVNKNIRNLYDSFDNETKLKYDIDVNKIDFNKYATESSLVCFNKYIQFKKNKKIDNKDIDNKLKNELNILIKKQKEENNKTNNNNNNNANTLTRNQKLEIIQTLIGGLGAKTSILIFIIMGCAAFILFGI